MWVCAMHDEEDSAKQEAPPEAGQLCPVCGAALIAEKCKLVCRSPKCVYRIVFNCAEF